MKAALLLLPVLFSLATKPLLGAAENAHKEPVLDFNGDELQANTPYYVVSIRRGVDGGGVTLGAPSNGTCPLYLVQQLSNRQNGLSVIFVSKDSDERVIYQFTDYQLIFSDIPTLMWMVEEPNEGTERRFITTSRVEGNLGAKTPSSWFSIESYPTFGYKLVSCATRCADVGRYFEDGARRLALGDDVDTFQVGFIRKDSQAVRLSKQ